MNKEVKIAAEKAADYMYHFMVDDINSIEENAEKAACNIYKYITGEEIDIKEFLGF